MRNIRRIFIKTYGFFSTSVWMCNSASNTEETKLFPAKLRSRSWSDVDKRKTFVFVTGNDELTHKEFEF